MAGYRSKYYARRERNQRLKVTRRNGIRHGYYRTEKGITTFENVERWFLAGVDEDFSIMQDPQSGEDCMYLKTDFERELEKVYREGYLRGSSAARDGKPMPRLKY